jgi:hypothetical protein
MLAYCLFFSHDVDVASAFGRKSMLPRVRDPDLADADYFHAGPDAASSPRATVGHSAPSRISVKLSY